MVKAPTVSGGLIDFHFDGGFILPESYHKKEYNMSDVPDTPLRILDFNSQ